MKKRLLLIIIAVISLNASACSTFCLKSKDHLLLGKNFDFYTGIGHVIVNKRNVRKQSFTLPGEKQLLWTSKYGSITFNQVGREFPYEGINEKGLVIEVMWLDETGYPEVDERYGLAEFQWIQYQLDNSSSVQDVLTSDAIVRISKASAPIHFLICDAEGNVATVEYLNGKMVSHQTPHLPVCALTNDTYAQSHSYFNTLTNAREHNFTSSSFDRFAKAAVMVQDFTTQEPIGYAFNILDAVKQDGLTRWSIVYDIKKMTIHFKTENNKRIRVLKVLDFDFSCSSPSLYLDVDQDERGGKLSFKPYVQQENEAIIDRALNVLSRRKEFSHLMPSEEDRKAIALYPETTYCDVK